jgi:hypothetical protein
VEDKDNRWRMLAALEDAIDDAEAVQEWGKKKRAHIAITKAQCKEEGKGYMCDSDLSARVIEARAHKATKPSHNPKRIRKSTRK